MERVDCWVSYTIITKFSLTIANSQERLFDTVSIVLVGKYTDLKDSYMSVTKALEHSAFRVHRKLILHVRTLDHPFFECEFIVTLVG